MVDLVLATTSPRRVELLKRMGLTFRTVDPGIDEQEVADSDPATTAMARAEAKALAVAAVEKDAIVLAADTVVTIDEETLDKAADDDEVRYMLQRLSGKTHTVHTALALCFPGFEDAYVVMDTASVTFRELAEDEVEWYVGTGEGVGKAGGYAVQGNGQRLVEELEGDVETVIGLPTALVRSMLEG